MYTKESEWRVPTYNNVVRSATHSKGELHVQTQQVGHILKRKSRSEHYSLDTTDEEYRRSEVGSSSFATPVVLNRGLRFVESFDAFPDAFKDTGYDSHPHTDFDESEVEAFHFDLNLATALSLSVSGAGEPDADADEDVDSDLDMVSWLGEEDTDSASVVTDIDGDWVDVYKDDAAPEEPHTGLACERPTYAQMTKLETA
ncbi:hypothetical protein EW145_g5965 [Phellinidium pouzarii]|uniref:Uncharacterized protein n=1 Tax=Phellinidium pouzarii TaxID=167371 RepID=A0A4S4KYE6_9AGAM|nr:hypothetical protein EW145_g5965 [Phellinidium pouzarii]